MHRVTEMAQLLDFRWRHKGAALVGSTDRGRS
jgi:hypothetical protein